jgi:hypothetical protein
MLATDGSLIYHSSRIPTKDKDILTFALMRWQTAATESGLIYMGQVAA